MDAESRQTFLFSFSSFCCSLSDRLAEGRDEGGLFSVIVGRNNELKSERR